ncbi:MAG: HDOD domain-containing protein [Pseudomonadales bacterium]|nr:HDOD domain-containing protein [Pseudomonadales bacterium]
MLDWLFKSKKNVALQRQQKPAEKKLENDSIFSSTASQSTLNEINSIYYDWLFAYSKNCDKPPAHELKRQQLALESRLQRTSAADLKLPRLPRVLPKLMLMMREPETKIKTLVDLISADPGLVFKVLSLANSVFYRFSNQPINDLQSALICLGEDGLKRMVVAAVLQPILTVEAPSFKKINDKLYSHVHATANIGLQLAQNSQSNAQTSYLLGLLQGAGNSALLSFLDTHCMQVSTDKNSALFLAQRIFERNHVDLSHKIAKHWQLGNELEETLAELAQTDTPNSLQAQLLKSSVVGAQIRLLANDNTIDHSTAKDWLKRSHLPHRILTQTH